MSVRWMRTAQISNGKVMEMVAWAKETTAYLEKKHGTPKIHTWIEAFGKVGTIRWTMDYPDLAAFEKMQTAVNMDPEYWKHVKKAVDAGLFIDGRTEDAIYREV